MTQAPVRQLVRQLITCERSPAARVPRACYTAKWLCSRGIHESASPGQDPTPLRKHLKDEAKRKRVETRQSDGQQQKRVPLESKTSPWELTVGIEVHAQLNTACKLFSNSSADASDSTPNSSVALFDAAMPGTQPTFQVAALLPAIRAALALGCTVQNESSWDRKHYFHWDQPNGYQITQYYRPFAKDGRIIVTAEDGVPATDLQGSQSLAIGIKQIQMEQDTGKTTTYSSTTHHVDLNRAGHPLIEIITLPQIHSPQTAAAVVRKLQAILKSVNACVLGMESGGLRADVNVSVRRRGEEGEYAYSGVGGLGQRTEIKNLSSFKAVQDAVIAERDRQILVLESGGKIEGETRGWTLGATQTTRLRGKEGEVDYRYSPDADLPALRIGRDLVQHLQHTLPELPDETVERVQRLYGLTAKDARTIVALDDGDRLDFLEQTVHVLINSLPNLNTAKLGKMVGNWVLHELGGLLTINNRTWEQLSITPKELASLLDNLSRNQITSRSAKHLLTQLEDRDSHGLQRDIDGMIDELNLRLRPLSEQGYNELASSIVHENPEMVAAVREKGQRGKIMWFVGQMMRKGEEGTVEPEQARLAVERILSR